MNDPAHRQMSCYAIRWRTSYLVELLPNARQLDNAATKASGLMPLVAKSDALNRQIHLPTADLVGRIATALSRFAQHRMRGQQPN